MSTRGCRHQEAAERALQRYPGPVGELIHRELTAYARLGHLLATATDTLIPMLTTYVLDPPPAGAPIPEPTRPRPGPVLWPRPTTVLGQEAQHPDRDDRTRRTR